MMYFKYSERPFKPSARQFHKTEITGYTNLFVNPVKELLGIILTAMINHVEFKCTRFHRFG